MNLELSLKQTLKLSPQMLQSMEILQMSTLELNESRSWSRRIPPPNWRNLRIRGMRARSCGGAFSPSPIWTIRTVNMSPLTGMSWTP